MESETLLFGRTPYETGQVIGDLLIPLISMMVSSFLVFGIKRAWQARRSAVGAFGVAAGIAVLFFWLPLSLLSMLDSLATFALGIIGIVIAWVVVHRDLSVQFGQPESTKSGWRMTGGVVVAIAVFLVVGLSAS